MGQEHPAPWEEPKPEYQPVEGVDFSGSLTGGRRKPPCKLHPANAATGFCTACGSPFCPACKTNALGRAICLTCYESTTEAAKRHEEEKKQLKRKLKQTYVRARWYLRGPVGAVVRFYRQIREGGKMPARRLAAISLNLPVLLGLTALLMIAGDITFQAPDQADLWRNYARPWSGLLAAFLYFWPAWGVFGQDLGKGAMGLVVRRANGQRLGLWRGFWRFFGMAGMLAWMGFGVLAIAWTRWILDFAKEQLQGKIALALWGIAGFFSLVCWLMALLMFLGKQNRHLADFLAQSVVMDVPRKEREGEEEETQEAGKAHDPEAKSLQKPPRTAKL